MELVSIVLASLGVAVIVVAAFIYCWRRGHYVAAVLSVIAPYLTVPFVMFLGDGRLKIRKDALARGADPSRWVPTYVDVGKRDTDGKTIMNYSFAVADQNNILFYECDLGLYEQRNTQNPFLYARRYIGRVAKSTVRAIGAFPLDTADVKNARHGAFWRDLLFNKTAGLVLNVHGKTVTMAAVVVIEVAEREKDDAKTVVFGVPHSGDVSGTSGFLGELLPEGLSTVFELGSLVMEYAECSEADHRGVLNAQGVVAGLQTLLGRAVSAPLTSTNTQAITANSATV